MVYIVHEASLVHLQVLNNVGVDESGGPRSIEYVRTPYSYGVEVQKSWHGSN